MTSNITLRQSQPANVTVRGASTVIVVRAASSNQLTLQSDFQIAIAPATTSTIGGIIVGNNLSITANGVLSAISSGGGGGGGGATAFSDLTDVLLTSPASGDLVAYNQTNLKWVNVKQTTVTDGGNF